MPPEKQDAQTVDNQRNHPVLFLGSLLPVGRGWSANNSLQATRDGGFSSAPRFTPIGPACLSYIWTLSLIVRIVKLAITFCSLSLLLTACRHTEPERSSTEADIRQHIEGQWTVGTNSDVWTPGAQIIIAADGSFTRVHSDGARELVGTWKLDRRILVVDTVKTNYATFQDGRTISLGTVQYYPVIFAGEHELVCAPGISVAGRLRFAR